MVGNPNDRYFISMQNKCSFQYTNCSRRIAFAIILQYNGQRLLYSKYNETNFVYLMRNHVKLVQISDL